jgi:hypothetical protein
MVLETAEKKRGSEHEKCVGHDSAGYGALHQRILPGTERRPAFGGKADIRRRRFNVRS